MPQQQGSKNNKNPPLPIGYNSNYNNSKDRVMQNQYQTQSLHSPTSPSSRSPQLPSQAQIPKITMTDEGFHVVNTHEQEKKTDVFGNPLTPTAQTEQSEYWHDEAHRDKQSAADNLQHELENTHLEGGRRLSSSGDGMGIPSEPTPQPRLSSGDDELEQFRKTEMAMLQQQHSQERRGSNASQRSGEHLPNGQATRTSSTNSLSIHSDASDGDGEEEPHVKREAKTLEQIMAFETNYPVPYRSRLTEPFEPGQTLIVKGKTGEDSVRFTINLHNTQADFSGHDVPLHLSVRFDEGKIVLNTFSKGEWGKEERTKNPYKKGDDVDFRIRAHDSKFQIFVDQKEVKEYEHRVPLSSITHFSIDGDVLITHIHWGGKYYPVPYESGLANEGLAPGKSLLIYGNPEKKAKRFHINLLKKNGDIALHFNPRFDEKAVVRNSLIANEWGNEEREGKIPFEKATGFDLEIKNEEYAFQILVNGERFASYAHRLEPHEINGLQIGGDVEITGIQIH